MKTRYSYSFCSFYSFLVLLGAAGVQAEPAEGAPDSVETGDARSPATGMSNLDTAPAPPAFRPQPAPGFAPTSPRRDFINISAIGTFAVGGSTEKDLGTMQPGGHDPGRRGFNLQGLELDVRGNVDPYFRAQANLVFDFTDEVHADAVEIEEAFVETLALPANLQVRAGQFFTEFGRFNTKHLHFWDFVDQPLVINRMFGPDGMRNPGARVSVLLDTPFYSELFLTAQQSTGEHAYSFRNDEGFMDSHVLFRPARVDTERGEEIRGLDDLLYTARYISSWDLTETQTVLAGTSASFGPNASTQDTNVPRDADPADQETITGSSAGRTEIYGVDFYWKWLPVDQVKGFPFVSLQTEGLLRRFEMRDPTETFEDYGVYVETLYGFTPGWVAGLRYDGVRGDMRKAVDRDSQSLALTNRTRISPNLTYYPSEFSKLRLQYNYDDRSGFGKDHSVWLQWEFSLGPHGAHPY